MTRDDDRFSNRELKLMFAQITEKLDDIHEQTIKTNGRVTVLEKQIIPINEKILLHDKVIIGAITIILVSVLGAVLKLIFL